MGLDVVELLMTVEQKYGISIPDEDARPLRSVGDLHAYVLSHVTPRPDPEDSWMWLRAMISEDFSVPLERVTPDAWIVRDLGIN